MKLVTIEQVRNAARERLLSNSSEMQALASKVLRINDYELGNSTNAVEIYREAVAAWFGFNAELDDLIL